MGPARSSPCPRPRRRTAIGWLWRGRARARRGVPGVPGSGRPLGPPRRGGGADRQHPAVRTDPLGAADHARDPPVLTYPQHPELVRCPASAPRYEHARPAVVDQRDRHRDFVILPGQDRKSTRLNSSHLVISYAVFCLKKKKKPYLYKWLTHTPAQSTSTIV